MGMFDYINYEAPCPNCGKKLSDWQSKDGACVLGKLEPWEVSSFYTSCDCGHWIDVSVEAEVEHIVKYLKLTTKSEFKKHLVRER